MQAPNPALKSRTGNGTVAGELLISVVIPCLNEADSIEEVVGKARETMEASGVRGEVVVVDNGSTDGSGELAEHAGARVIREARPGYGSAYLAGFGAAEGRYIVMGDADDSYDFTEIGRFVAELEDGADLVIGNRLRGIEPGAMPWLHRYVGNPVLTGILNLSFGAGVSDAHCGMRAFRRSLLPALDLRTTGMEFASEHVIRASKLGLDIREVDIRYRPRRGESKLSSFSDGWRHLRFLLVHSPTWLFVIPGAAMLAVGLVAGVVTLADVELLGRRWQLHAMIAAVLLAVSGAQVLQLGAFARAYAYYYLGEHDPLLGRVRRGVRLEHGLVAGAGLLVVGLAISGYVLVTWLESGLGALREEKLALAGVTFIVLGMQTVFGAFFLSILGLRRRPHAGEPDAT